MQLTYISHACVLIETTAGRFLTDPWLVGPSQANGWWHVPKPNVTVKELPSINYIMISHVHDDHFHLPTLEQLPKTATVLVPYAVDSWMADTVRQLGFRQVLEMQEGQCYHLAGGVKVKNFQRGRIDSAFWLKDGDQTLLNLNDCPAAPHWLKVWRRQHPAPDIALSAFSYASPYPVCYDIPGMDREALRTDTSKRVLAQFAATMAILTPRYAVPFATQYGFLASDQLWMNAYLPTPVDALKELAIHNSRVHGVLLNPGDKLSITDGCQLTRPPFDWSHRDEILREMAHRDAKDVEQAFAGEPKPPADLFDRFQAYFTTLLRRNRFMRRRIGVPIAFIVEPDRTRWVVDSTTSRRPVHIQNGRSAPIEITLPSSLLFTAIDGQIHWETLYLSNRLRIQVPRELLPQEWNFWRMLFNFPRGILRDRLRLLTPRGCTVLWRRRQEVAQMVVERLRCSSQREPYREV